MRILHVITDLKDGGAEAVLFRLISMDSSNQHCVICLGDGGKYQFLLEDMDIPVIALDIKGGLKAITRFMNLSSVLKSFKPNVIQGWMYHGNLVASFLGWTKKNISVAWGIHHTNLVVGVDPLLTHYISKVLAFISVYFKNAVDAIICCGDKSKIIHSSYGYNNLKLNVIKNGYDTSHFKIDVSAGSLLRKKLGISDETFLIGSVGRFAPQKDHKNLITALGRFKSKFETFHVLLVGKDCDEKNEELKKLISANSLERYVSLLGPRNDIVHVMNALDVHVTSSAFGEAFPNVICEAMSCGTVCVTTDVGDAGEIVKGSGRVVPPSDSKALADAIEDFYLIRKSSANEWEDLSKVASYKINHNFSLEIMIEQYNLIWHNLVGK